MLMKKVLLLAGLLLPIWGGNLSAQLSTPCTFSFPDEETFNASWKVDDTDNNSEVFTFDAANAAVKLTCKGDAKDWLINTQGIEMKAGETYSVKINAKTDARYNSQYFYTYFGKSAEIADLTQRVESADLSISSTSFEETERGSFTPTEDGVYYIGIYYYNNSSLANGTFTIKQISVSAKPTYPAAATGVTATAGENGVMEVTLSWTNPATNTDGGALKELTGVKIYRGTSAWFSISSTNLITTVTDGITMGETTTWKDTTITTSGKYYYKVVPFNSNGNSTATSVTAGTTWVGNDTPLAVTDITVTAIDDYSASIDFTLPAEGKNGGYVDAAAVTYLIERKGSGTYSSYTTLETAYAGALPYVDSSLAGLDTYTYRITPSFDGKSPAAATSTATVLGCATLPYTQAFSSSSSLNFFTIIDNNKDNKTWSYYSSYVRYNGISGAEADDYLITPKFNLTAGKVYQLTYESRIGSAGNANEKNLAVTIGKAATAEAQTTQLFNEKVTSTTATARNVNFAVEEDGGYYIGLHVYGAANAYALNVDNLSLKEIELLPAAAANLSVAPAAEGKLSATVTWNNPSLTNIGTDITALSKVELYRGETLVYTQETPVVGGAEKYIDPVDAAGEYGYKVIGYIDGRAGEATEIVTAWIGSDQLAAPADVQASLNADGQPVVTFTAPTEGLHGGYVDLSQTAFRIVRNLGKADEKVVASATTETTFTDTEELPLAQYIYTVFAINGDVESEGTSSNGIIAGGALDLPYTADFSNAEAMSLWTIADDGNDNKTWKYSQTGAYMEVSTSGSDEWVYTPPLMVTYAGKHIVSFAAYSSSAIYEEVLDVALCSSTNPNDPYTVIETYNIAHRSEATYTKEVEIPTTGKWHIGFHSKPETSGMGLYLSAAHVEGSIGTGLDAARTDAKTYYDRSGETLHFAGRATVSVSGMTGTTFVNGVKATNELSLKQLPKGAYIAVVTGSDGMAHAIKFIK